MERRKLKALFLVILPTLVILAITWGLMYWRVPTGIEARLAAERAVFILGGTDPVQISPVDFQSMTVEQFSEITFSPRILEVADPAQYVLTGDRYPDSAWTELAVTAPVAIKAEDGAPQTAITLESSRSTAGQLDRIWVHPGTRVIVEMTGRRTMTLALEQAPRVPSAIATFRGPFRLITDSCRFHGAAGPAYRAASLSYRAELSKHFHDIEITGRDRSLIMTLTLTSDSRAPGLFTSSVPVQHLEFIRQGSLGNPETTLVGDDEIAYSGHPRRFEESQDPARSSRPRCTGFAPRFLVSRGDFVALDRLRDFTVREIVLEPQQQALRFDLEGVAGRLKVGVDRDDLEDCRLTRFDTLWHHPRLLALATIAFWLLPTSLSFFKFLKELKK